ncbi:hypothetical protein CALVIDRAFT_536474 [Calocera viscosa TUFC12733]|uniref:Cryptic loci regulator 2 N-terminal domain-containing protein n=1 Tax=Calocera viscosa (strain TUFC12733) TaxID=1330018 RepID=A0A167MS12_CALVF|nr:hypothetical protein CALVIDRAFT_536474 [Calocera viscosa TUFC12733]
MEHNATPTSSAQAKGENGHVDAPTEAKTSTSGKQPSLFDDFMAFSAQEEKDAPGSPGTPESDVPGAIEQFDSSADAAIESLDDAEREIAGEAVPVEDADVEPSAALDEDLDDLFEDDEDPTDPIEPYPTELGISVLDDEDPLDANVPDKPDAIDNAEEVIPSPIVEDPNPQDEVDDATEPAAEGAPADEELDDAENAALEDAEEQAEKGAEDPATGATEDVEETEKEPAADDETVDAPDEVEAGDGTSEVGEEVEDVIAVDAVEVIETDEPAKPGPAEGDESMTEPLNEVEVVIDIAPQETAAADVSMDAEDQPAEDQSDADADGSPEPPGDEGEDERPDDTAPQDDDAMEVDGAEVKYEMPDENGHIHFRVSDGSSDRLPGSRKGPPLPARMEVVPRDSDTQKAFLKRVGQGVAQNLMGLTGKKYTMHDLPKNYRLYGQARANGSESGRPDIYLYGSKTVTKFRSTLQFIPHAIWLLTDPTLNTRNCRCFSCSKRSEADISKEFASANVSPERPLKRKSSTIIKPEATVKKIKLADPPIPRDNNSARPKAVRADREADLASLDRLESPREGEIIWCTVDPPIAGKKPGETIEFWPCIVVQHEVSRKVVPTEANPKASGTAPAWEVQALGTVCNAHVRAEDILPYQAYDIPQSTKDVLMQFRPVSTAFDDLMRFYPFSPALKDKPRTLTKRRSKPELGDQSQIARSFKNAAPALILALHMCDHLDKGWTATDAYSHPVPAQNVENPPPISIQNPARRFEGVFWGPERIWEGDFVRLNLEFTHDLPDNDYRKHLLQNMTAGSDGRGLFMHINAFHYLSYGVDSSTSNERKECWMAGPVFETVFDHEVDPAVLSGETNDPLPLQSPNFDLVRDAPILSASALGILAERNLESVKLPHPVQTKYPWPPAPSGFKFRPLLAKDEELYVNISCLAGRYYPTIFFKQLLSGMHNMDKSKNDVGTPQLLSLAGLMPGHVYPTKCEKHYRDRATMLVTAEEQAKEELGENE